MTSVRQITDARTLSALVHPLRRRLLDVLKVEGAATVSVLAASTDQAVGNVSHHLRVLSAAQLVEPAPDRARDRRERWWRLTSPAVRWSSSDFPGDQAAVAAADSLNLERQIELVRAWAARAAGPDDPWSQAAFSSDSWLRLTPAELSELSAEVIAVLGRWRDRPAQDVDPDAEPVFVFARGVPARP